MEIKLTLALPRDAMSVPVVRRILKASLETLGVVDDCVSDIEVALTEACSNVLHHAAGEEEYEISCGVNGSTCLIEVVDRGAGFDPAERGRTDASESAESGRGIQLMRALVDRVSFEQHDQAGTVVRLEKQLVWHPDAALTQLEKSPTRTGPWSRDETLKDAPEPR